MSCSLNHCFGKSKQLDPNKINEEIKEVLYKGHKRSRRKSRRSHKKRSPKRRSPKRRSPKRRSPKRRRSRKFGYQVLRNDQIIKLVNSNKVYNNLLCD